MIILDASKMKTRTTAHAYLKEALSFPDYYGKNLDALYECLTELGETEVGFIHMEGAGDFFQKILRVFRDAHKANPDLVIADEKTVLEAEKEAAKAAAAEMDELSPSEAENQEDNRSEDAADPDGAGTEETLAQDRKTPESADPDEVADDV